MVLYLSITKGLKEEIPHLLFLCELGLISNKHHRFIYREQGELSYIHEDNMIRNIGSFLERSTGIWFLSITGENRKPPTRTMNPHVTYIIFFL